MCVCVCVYAYALAFGSDCVITKSAGHCPLVSIPSLQNRIIVGNVMCVNIVRCIFFFWNNSAKGDYKLIKLIAVLNIINCCFILVPVCYYRLILVLAKPTLSHQN